jgi:maltose phosphorylase
MNKYLKVDPWCIIEEKFDTKNHRASESIFSIGNGRFGQRANFEEQYSGDSLLGNYIAGVYYPDKTKVGWWKNGYPEYFAKVLNAPNWIGVDIWIENEVLDLAKCKVLNFKRILNMKEGYLHRQFIAEMPSGKQIRADVLRLISIVNQEIGAIRYSITPINFSGKVSVTACIDGNVKNEDANYGEYFWEEVERDISGTKGFLVSRTRKTEFEICMGMQVQATLGGNKFPLECKNKSIEKYIASSTEFDVPQDSELVIYKYVSVLSSLNHPKDQIRKNAETVLTDAVNLGFDRIFSDQKTAWGEIWEHSDIFIDGDPEAQQAIRFNIFQLNQTYTGEDERLNIGPKGFTGEKYGGSTYWDTEAYCIPFFLSTAKQKVSRNLLIYRYKQLQKAIENAKKLGFSNGAALFPMVTMNGEECHNEWEITFEEIHRNGAIAFAVYNYVRYHDDSPYLIDYGLELLIGIARFWKQRVNFSKEKGKYVMLGVTGPNEYENNVSNNWYTNTIATWTLKYTLEAIDYVKKNDPGKFAQIVNKISFDEISETKAWKDIVDNMYFPVLEGTRIFLQQDGYMDKEQMTADELDPSQRPISQNWSWDRILRSCFIKQADVLQGIYLFEDRFDTETIKENFDFYESRTVHESSLSPCVHTIVAARIGNIEKAYNLYLRTSRLDLDDYNNEVKEGLHITSMAGTWMSVVEGFGGKRIKENKLVLNPQIPAMWKSYSFKLLFRNILLSIKVDHANIQIYNESQTSVYPVIYGKEYHIAGNTKEIVAKAILTKIMS